MLLISINLKLIGLFDNKFYPDNWFCRYLNQRLYCLTIKYANPTRVPRRYKTGPLVDVYSKT